MGEEIIHGSRWRNALFMLLSAVFTAGAAWMLLKGETDWRAYLGLVLFGAGVVVFALQIIWPPRLELGPHFFTIVSMGRTTRVAWADVEGFRLWKPPRGRPMVAWTLKPGRGKTGVLASMNRAIGVDGCLPPTLGGAKDLLARVDQHFRLRQGQGPSVFASSSGDLAAPTVSSTHDRPFGRLR